MYHRHKQSLQNEIYYEKFSSKFIINLNYRAPKEPLDDSFQPTWWKQNSNESTRRLFPVECCVCIEAV